MTNWYKITQSNEPEYYLDNFLLIEAEKAATGANIHHLRTLMANYKIFTQALNKKKYENLEHKNFLITARNNSEQKLKDFIEQSIILKNKKNKRIK